MDKFKPGDKVDFVGIITDIDIGSTGYREEDYPKDGSIGTVQRTHPKDRERNYYEVDWGPTTHCLDHEFPEDDPPKPCRLVLCMHESELVRSIGVSHG